MASTPTDVTLTDAPPTDAPPTESAATESPLFTPFTLGRLTLPNRIVLAPMTRVRASAEGVMPGMAAEYYARRASGGLLITEATQVLPNGAGGRGTPGIHDGAQIAAWRRVTDAVHAAGGRIYLQLWHTGRAAHPSFLPAGAEVVSASAVPIEGEVYTPAGRVPYATPRPLAVEEIPRYVEAYARGARNAIAAGFDGVEVHAANGYLIDQFLRDGSNRRTDAYGGSIENRSRFLLEVVRAVADAVGADRTGVRVSPTNAFQSMSDSDPAAGVAVEWRHFAPAGAFPNATGAALAAEAAGLQERRGARRAVAAGGAHADGAYWAMHEALMAAPSPLWPERVDGVARALGLNVARLHADARSGAALGRVEAQRAAAIADGVRGMPSAFLDGARLDLDDLDALRDEVGLGR